MISLSNENTTSILIHPSKHLSHFY